MSETFEIINPSSYTNFSNNITINNNSKIYLMYGTYKVKKFIVNSNCVVKVIPKYYNWINFDYNSGVGTYKTNRSISDLDQNHGQLTILAEEIQIDGIVDASGAGYMGGGGGIGGVGGEKDPSYMFEKPSPGIGYNDGKNDRGYLTGIYYKGHPGCNGGNGGGFQGGKGGIISNTYTEKEEYGAYGEDGEDAKVNINETLDFNCDMGSGGGGGAGGSGGGGSDTIYLTGGGGGGGGGGGCGGGKIILAAKYKFVLSSSGKIKANGMPGFNAEKGYNGGLISNGYPSGDYEATNYYINNLRFYALTNAGLPARFYWVGGRGGNGGNSFPAYPYNNIINQNGSGGERGAVCNYRKWNYSTNGYGGKGGNGGGGAGGSVVIGLGCFPYDNLNLKPISVYYNEHPNIGNFIIKGSIETYGVKTPKGTLTIFVIREPKPPNIENYYTINNGGTIKIFSIEPNILKMLKKYNEIKCAKCILYDVLHKVLY
jgi:hypothetical protein